MEFYRASKLPKSLEFFCIRDGQKIRGTKFEARSLFQILLKMRSVAGYTPDSLVEFEAKILFKCSSYFFTVPHYCQT
jgi:hypothetical protein